MVLCECGCGREVAIYRGTHRRFIRGHHSKGVSRSDEHKKKISEAHKGNNFALGYKHTDETLKKMRCRKHTNETKEKIAKANRGEKGPSWKGGISFEPYCSKFNNSFKESEKDIFDRKCVMCGKTETENRKKLSVHHVNYNKECLCAEVECEFVPLCRSCHSKTNHSRDYYENMILEKLEELN